MRWSSLLGLEDRVAVVVGGGRLGHAICEHLARAGCDVAVGDLSLASAQAAADAVTAHGRRAIARQADARERADVDELVAAATEKFGRLDVAVNNVGARNVRQASLLDVSSDAFDDTVALCLKTTFVGMQSEALAMARLGNGGSIVNVASASAFVAADGFGVYGAGKAGVVQMTKTAAVELARFGIRVNCVAPGVMAEGVPSTASGQNFRSDNERATAIQRVGSFPEVAGIAVFFAGELSSYVTGQTLIADGGQTIRVNRPQRDPYPAAAAGIAPLFDVDVSTLAN